jgi:D-beta-D-heptose 7-phosphate kinase/D-beta-D-heptose 1-phosphate adenosyltransferase
VVLADGCFDPIHYGHVQYLDAAGQYGALMVRCAGDDAIRAKGRVPFQSHSERLQTIRRIRPVQFVCTAPTLADAVRDHRPTHLIKGKDWIDQLPEDVVQACMETGTQIVFVETQAKSSRERLEFLG